MDEILKTYEPVLRAGRPPLHPWAKWFDGRTFRIRRKVHFKCNPESMDDLIRKTAKRKGFRVSLHHEPGEAIVLTARKIEEPKKRGSKRA